MNNILKCACGQELDVEGFQPGDQVRCPHCQAVLTVPAMDEAKKPTAAPEGQLPAGVGVDIDPGPTSAPVAMAIADDSEDRPARPVRKRTLSPMEQRRLTEQRASAQAQRKLQKVMIWPCIVLGLLSLASAGGGFYWTFGPKTIEVEKDAQGIEHLYARVPKAENPGDLERIEVQPALWPVDDVVTENGVWYVQIGDELTPIAQKGLWFYRADPATKQPWIDPNTGKAKRLVDLKLKAQTYMQGDEGGDSIPVDIRGTDMLKAGTETPLKVQFYRLTADGFQDQAIMGDFEHYGPPLGIPPWVFIAAGLPIALLLFAAAGSFAYGAYYSKAAKAEAAKRAADEAAVEQSRAAASGKAEGEKME